MWSNAYREKKFRVLVIGNMNARVGDSKVDGVVHGKSECGKRAF